MSIDVATEGLALLAAAFLMLPATAYHVIYGTPVPQIVYNVAPFLWLVWFAKWAAEGGMPRMGVLGR